MDKYGLAKPIADAPKDGTRILLRFGEEGWIEGAWEEEDGPFEAGWWVISLNSHGCGCCSSNNGEPDMFMDIPQ